MARSRWTKSEVLLVSGIGLILLIGANVAAHWYLTQFHGVNIYANDYVERQASYVKEPSTKFAHPFYGLNDSTKPGFDSDVSVESAFIRVSPQPQTGEAIKVLVLGGSVAMHLSKGRDGITQDYLFSRLLNRHFKTERFVVYNAAFGGGKQPQQYFKYLYLDLLGFRPDVVINYDGFNEIALPFADNRPRELNAIYPRSFDRTVYASAADTDCIAFNNQLLSLNTHLPIAELAKWVWVLRCHQKVTGESFQWPHTRAAHWAQETRSYLDHAVAVWAQSSNKLYQALDQRAIPYIHAIQPNQYYPSSKPFSDQERDNALGYTPYGDPIKAHYHRIDPALLESPNAIDQRGLFANTQSTRYSDACCHLNRQGMSAIAQDLIERNEATFQALVAREPVTP